MAIWRLMKTVIDILALQFFGAHTFITVISVIILYINNYNVLLNSLRNFEYYNQHYEGKFVFWSEIRIISIFNVMNIVDPHANTGRHLGCVRVGLIQNIKVGRVTYSYKVITILLTLIRIIYVLCWLSITWRMSCIFL